MNPGYRTIESQSKSLMGPLGLLIAFYYALVGYTCAWTLRRELTRGAKDLVLKAVLPLLKKSGAGSVIFLGSIDGFRGMPENPGYSASKGALIPLTHCLAHTHGPDGIRFNYIATAAILHTGPDDLQRGSWLVEGVMERVAARQMYATPLRRMCRPQDVASVASFLASDDSAYVTGSAITVDGGRTAYTPMTYQQQPELH